MPASFYQASTWFSPSKPVAFQIRGGFEHRFKSAACLNSSPAACPSTSCV